MSLRCLNFRLFKFLYLFSISILGLRLLFPNVYRMEVIYGTYDGGKQILTLLQLSGINRFYTSSFVLFTESEVTGSMLTSGLFVSRITNRTG